LCGDARAASALIDRLTKTSTEDTILNGLSVPIVRAAIAVIANRPQSALDELAHLTAQR
jgi:hypothetical protein